MKKVHKVIESILYWVCVVFAGCGMGAVTSKCLGEDAWSWEGWSTKHKVLYYVITTVLAVPMAAWFVFSHNALTDKMNDDEDDEF